MSSNRIRNTVTGIFCAIVAVVFLLMLISSQTETGLVMRVVLASFVGASILVAGIIFLGRSTGRGYTSATLRRLKRKGIVRPEYERFENCTPAEFGVIIDGQCGRNEMVAETMHLYFRGYITLEKTQDGKVTPKLLPNVDLQPLSDIDKILLSAIASSKLPDGQRFQEVVMQSLRTKGWVVERKSRTLELAGRAWSRLKSLSVFMRIFLFIIGMVLVVPAIGFAAFTLTAGGDDLFVYTRADSVGMLYAMAMMIGAVLSMLLILLGLPIVLAIIATTYAFVEGFKGVTIIARNYSPKYKQHYTDVLGLHQYLIVSGMDTMTPDYALLDFKGLDPLYPYAIAAGLDKKITEIL